MYINCHSYYSLRHGTLSPSRLVELGTALGAEVMALTDINNTSATIEFVNLCHRAGIRPIAGIDFRRDHKCLYIGLAQTQVGFAHLTRLLSRSSLSGTPLPDRAPLLPDTHIIYPLTSTVPQDLRDNEWVGIRPGQLNRLHFSVPKPIQRRLVVLSPLTFADEAGFNLHRLLRAIDLNIVGGRLADRHTAPRTDRPVAADQLRDAFAAFPHILNNTRTVTDSCHFNPKTGLTLNRQTFTGSKEGDLTLLEKLAMRGCEGRYGSPHARNCGTDKQAKERIHKELQVIRKQDFGAYFLISWDIIRYARSMGYRHVGRGSGANSIVAYCIGLTDVDPIELNLYFERFINPYRSSPPDFDLDFSWDERDDIIDYIIKRYGPEHTAMMAAYSTFKGRSAIREVGKVFGLPKEDIDRIIREPAAADRHHPLARNIHHYARQLEGFPNHLSIHAGGILIAEQPLYNQTALQQMPKGFPITHFDMHHAEDWGLHKYDILSQRGLGHLKMGAELVRRNRGEAVNLDDLEAIKADEQVKALLRKGRCMGCFYIESPAMRGLLQKLGCDNYVHLVAASSIIRPGVAKSGMMREYIQRFHNPRSVSYPHPAFEAQLGETFGVMVYQEDVMKILHHFAGLDLDESDVLRRIMSGKKAQHDTFEHLRRKYLDNCRQRGYSDELTQEVWRQVESFSGYSFCKAHSASFAVESFQSLYLKAHYPLEFMVAVINNFGGFYSTEHYLHEARMQGATIHAPCINHSQYLTDLIGTDIYLGFIHLKQLEQQTARHIVNQRTISGHFRSLDDFLQRVRINPEQLDILIRIGAFRFTGKSKQELMWEKSALLDPKEHHHSTTPSLFAEDAPEYELPELESPENDVVMDQLELLGFTLTSPFDLWPPDEHIRQSCIKASAFSNHIRKQIRIIGAYVCRKDLRTSNNKIMCFGTWIDEDGLFFDTVHFPEALRRSPFRGTGLYVITGTVTEDFGVCSVEVTKMEKVER